VGITTLFKLKIGLGTALNMIFIGVFTDIIIFTDLVPVGSGLLSGVVMLTFGMFFMSLGTYLYLSCEMGCGPRDGLMVVLTVLTKKPVNIIRRSIEFGALIVGVLLGGKVGIGTFVIAFGLGGFMKLIFEFCNFDVSNAEHLAFKDTFGYVKDLIEAEKSEKAH
ncbi:MAG: YczE/YyaS/YitT family protein, partial [Peptostreptococcaceae bacterium]